MVGEASGEVEAAHVLPHQLGHLLDIPILHLAQAWDKRLLGHVVPRIECLLGHAMRHCTETNLEQLLGVERAVVIPSTADGRGNHHARRVDSLEYTSQMALPSDFLDEDGGQALAAELLVYAEKVNLGRVVRLLANTELVGNARDEGNQLLCARHTHTQVPRLVVARMFEDPGRRVRSGETSPLHAVRTHQCRNSGE